MAQASRRTDFTGPALVRLLASLTQADVPGSSKVFAERLSQWVGWTDAITLSAALSGGGGPAQGGGQAEATRPVKRPRHAQAASPATPLPAATVTATPTTASTEQADAQHVRAGLFKALADGGDLSVTPTARGRRGRQPVMPPAPVPIHTATAIDYAPYRWLYLARQQTMHTSITPLRARLRQALAARSPALAQLAVLDAAMERVLGAQERSLLATVPALLERHFMRQRSEADANGPGWLQQFQQDMHSVLLAELELRFLPIEGLLAALHQGTSAAATPTANAAASQPASHPAGQPA